MSLLRKIATWLWFLTNKKVLRQMPKCCPFFHLYENRENVWKYCQKQMTFTKKQGPDKYSFQGHFGWPVKVSQTYGCGPRVDVVCTKAENGWKRVGRQPADHSQCSKNSESCVHIAPSTLVHTVLDFILFLYPLPLGTCVLWNLWQWPCHAVVWEMCTRWHISRMNWHSLTAQ